MSESVSEQLVITIVLYRLVYVVLVLKLSCVSSFIVTFTLFAVLLPLGSRRRK